MIIRKREKNGISIGIGSDGFGSLPEVVIKGRDDAKYRCVAKFYSKEDAQAFMNALVMFVEENAR